MHLALFGATGRTGQRVVGQALAFGHTVTALARDPSRLAGSQSLTIVRGDVLDPVAVGKTMAGAHAVLVTLGGGSLEDPGNARSQGMRTIVPVMQRAAVTRIVASGSAGVLDALPGPGLQSEQPGYPTAFPSSPGNIGRRGRSSPRVTSSGPWCARLTSRTEPPRGSTRWLLTSPPPEVPAPFPMAIRGFHADRGVASPICAKTGGYHDVRGPVRPMLKLG